MLSSFLFLLLGFITTIWLNGLALIIQYVVKALCRRKILQRMSGNKIQVISKNTNYAPFTVDLNTEYFKIISKVIWFGVAKDVC